MGATAFSYVCAAGHHIESTYALKACPVFAKGCPCCGVLQRVGPGSRKANAETRRDVS